MRMTTNKIEQTDSIEIILTAIILCVLPSKQGDDAPDGPCTELLERIQTLHETVQPAVTLLSTNPNMTVFQQAAAQALRAAQAELDETLLALAKDAVAQTTGQVTAPDNDAQTTTVSGSGAIATGDGVASGEGGVALRGSVFGDISIKNIFASPDPTATAGDKAKRRYLQRLFDRCNLLPLASLGSQDRQSRDHAGQSLY